MKSFIALLVLVLGVQLALAQLPNGDRTLLHTQTATTFDKGKLVIYNNMNFFTKAGDFIGKNQPPDFKLVNYWLVAGNTVLTYGVMDHLDVSAGLRVYQDTHYPNEYNLPGDVFLTIRAGSFPFGNGHFHAAGLTSIRFPVGEVHNYPFAEYASGAVEFGFLGAFSFYADPYLPDRAFSAHFNMGIWDHNELGKTLYTYSSNCCGHSEGEELTATVSSKDFRMALAAVFPTYMFDFRMELSGIVYITKPDPFVYSAEEWAYFSPSIRYKALSWLSMDLGMDFRISPSDRQWTTADIPDISKSVDMPPNYPAWKVHLQANITLDLLGKKSRPVEDYEVLERQQQVKEMEVILNEKEKAKKAAEEIQNLKKVRQEAEKEIEELRKLLEEE